MTGGKETCCSLCHGEIGPDIQGRVMCYGCGPSELIPPEQRKARALERARTASLEPVVAPKVAASSLRPAGLRRV